MKLLKSVLWNPPQPPKMKIFWRPSPSKVKTDKVSPFKTTISSQNSIFQFSSSKTATSKVFQGQHFHSESSVSVQNRVFASVTDELTVQDHLSNKTTVSTYWTLSPWRSQLYWWMAFSRPFSKWKFHLDWIRSVCWTPNNENAEMLSQCYHEWPFQDHLSSTTLLTCWALSPGRC